MNQIELLNKLGMIDSSDSEYRPELKPDPNRGIRIALEALRQNPKANPKTIEYLEKLLKRVDK